MTNNSRYALLLGVAVAITMVISACGSSSTTTGTTPTTGSGKCSGATITVNLGGSKTGLANAEAGSVNIGHSDVKADPVTQADLVDHRVAVVIFAVITNKGVGVTGLTNPQEQALTAGLAAILIILLLVINLSARGIGRAIQRRVTAA